VGKKPPTRRSTSLSACLRVFIHLQLWTAVDFWKIRSCLLILRELIRAQWIEAADVSGRIKDCQKVAYS
jgi:hypothetical protein